MPSSAPWTTEIPSEQAAVKVWLTRSEPGAGRQARDLESRGYEVLVLPVIEVEALDTRIPDGPFDFVVFLSEHAVRFGLPALSGQSWFPAARILAVGARTAAVLGQAGHAAANPGQPTSEGLLALPALQQPGRVLVVAGQGGRQLLEPAVTARGGLVQRFECYRRRPRPPANDAPVLQCDVIIAASGEALQVVAPFWLSAGGRRDVPVLVPSARVAGLGVELGLQTLHDCGGADSGAWLRGLASLESPGAGT